MVFGCRESPKKLLRWMDGWHVGVTMLQSFCPKSHNFFVLLSSRLAQTLWFSLFSVFKRTPCLRNEKDNSPTPKTNKKTPSKKKNHRVFDVMQKLGWFLHDLSSPKFFRLATSFGGLQRRRHRQCGRAKTMGFGRLFWSTPWVSCVFLSFCFFESFFFFFFLGGGKLFFS